MVEETGLETAAVSSVDACSVWGMGEGDAWRPRPPCPARGFEIALYHSNQSNCANIQLCAYLIESTPTLPTYLSQSCSSRAASPVRAPAVAVVAAAGASTCAAWASHDEAGESVPAWIWRAGQVSWLDGPGPGRPRQVRKDCAYG